MPLSIFQLPGFSGSSTSALATPYASCSSVQGEPEFGQPWWRHLPEDFYRYQDRFLLPRSLQRLVDLNVDGIMTDYPQRLLKIVKRN